MSRWNAGWLGFVLIWACCPASAADKVVVKSGLQPGEKIGAIFEPLNVNGEYAGEPHCLVCENGLNPVAMIFARETSAPLVGLIAKLDALAAKHRDQGLGCFVVFLGEQETLQPKLAEIVKKKQLKHVILSIDAAAGPDGFKVAPESDVTVVLYREHLVHANHAFAKDKLNDRSTEAILADLPKILKK